MKCVNAGDLRHKVTVQTAAKTSDGAGGFTDVWSDLLTAWAAITPASGYERMIAMQASAPITHKIMMRYDSRITTAKRIVFETRIFNITEVINEGERNAWLKITAVEGAAT